MCIASAISLLMILICGMATYGAYKVTQGVRSPSETAPAPLQTCCTCVFQLRSAWIIPFFCYQIFDFALNTLVAVSIVVYPNTVQDYLQQLVGAPFFSPTIAGFCAKFHPPSFSLRSRKTSHTRTRSLPSVTSAWCSSFCSSSPVFWASR